MKIKTLNFVKKHYPLIWILVMAFTIAFFFTSNSPFYKFDGWEDSGVYAQVGHSWITHNLIPYKDVFDHKGPLHFLIFGIGTLWKVQNSYFGVFIIEFLFIAMSTYFYFKTSKLLTNNTKVSLLIATFVQLIMFSTVDFLTSHYIINRNVLLTDRGGSPEEFCVAFISVIVYYLTLMFKNKSLNLSSKQWFIFGLMCSFIFLEKFTLALPFYLLCFVILVISFIKQRKYFVKILMWGSMGLFIPLIVTVLYFYLNHALNDFITYYFKVNVTNYSIGEQKPIFEKALEALRIGVLMTMSNIVLFAGVLLSILGFIFSKKVTSYFKVTMLALVAFIFEISLLPGRDFSHYLLPIMPVTLIGLSLIFPAKLLNQNNKTYVVSIISTFVVLLIFSLGSANESMHFSKPGLGKRVPAMIKMANIIKADKNYDPEKTNLLVWKSNFATLHTLTNTTPKTRFFYMPGMEIPEYNKEVLQLFKNKKPDYIYTNDWYEDNEKRNNLTPMKRMLRNLLWYPDPKAGMLYRKYLKNYKVVFHEVDSNHLEHRMEILFKRK